jgi:hypothetical protein
MCSTRRTCLPGTFLHPPSCGTGHVFGHAEGASSHARPRAPTGPAPATVLSPSQPEWSHAAGRRGTHTGSFPLNEFKSGSPPGGAVACPGQRRSDRNGSGTPPPTSTSSPRSFLQPAQAWRRRAMGKIHNAGTPNDPAQVQRRLQPESIPCQPYRCMSSSSAPQSWRPRSKLSKGRWRR